MVIVRIICLALSYLGLGMGFFPYLRMNRATIAFVGSAFMVGLGVVTLEEGWGAIDVNTIVFLLSMMIINSYLSYGGFFNLVIQRLLQFSLSAFGLMVILTFSTAFLSALFLNDTLVLVMTPLVLKLTINLGLNPIPYLLAIASATNLGSLPTLNGNPQNILVASFSGIGYLDFLQTLSPIAVVSLFIQIALLYLLYPNVRSRSAVIPSHQPLTITPLPPVKTHLPLLIKTLVITAIMLIGFVVGMPLAETAFIAAALLLITRRLKAQKVLQQINWSLLLMFSGLFILTRSVQNLNLLDIFVPYIDHPWGLVTVTAILSNLISNVPAVLLIKDFMADNPQNWILLASSSTLAGNLSLFGSVANLIMVESAKSEGYHLSFTEHLRFGFPLTVITILLTLNFANLQF
ncbi:MAG: anion transporter [Cyanobacterium sp.]